MATHSSILAWEIPWTEEPGWLQSMGLQRVDTTEVTEYRFSAAFHPALIQPCYSDVTFLRILPNAHVLRILSPLAGGDRGSSGSYQTSCFLGFFPSFMSSVLRQTWGQRVSPLCRNIEHCLHSSSSPTLCPLHVAACPPGLQSLSSHGQNPRAVRVAPSVLWSGNAPWAVNWGILGLPPCSCFLSSQSCWPLSGLCKEMLNILCPLS